MFILRSPHGTIVLLLYVDDIILTGSNEHFLESFVRQLSSEFAMKDLGPLHYFLGIEVIPTPTGLFLSQGKYAQDLLQRAHMSDCNAISTPMALKSTIDYLSDAFPNPSLYRSIVGALQYLTITRPDLSYAVNSVCQHMHAPKVGHMQLVKRILRYVRGTFKFGLHLLHDSTLDLYAFSDADWASCPLTRRSMTGYGVFLGSNLISWAAKKQPTVSRSSAEAEYQAMAVATAEVTWISFILRDLGIPLPTAATLFCDNISALYMSINPVFHARSKHIEIDYHFVREKVAQGDLITKFVRTSHQLADVFTKPLPRDRFQTLRSKLGVLSPSLLNLRGSKEEESQQYTKGKNNRATNLEIIHS